MWGGLVGGRVGGGGVSVFVVGEGGGGGASVLGYAFFLLFF